ncbi:proline dehydrogenase family protein [Aureibaculum sp. 2210JD6-5]|uniref:proline dehydrogenase family protein n=1 Tax=Aureibaculum sp. 2210JD6-5 TaxID=3103957 RepID=UPI002AAC7B7E|nr:proline dehydrogenase family protein [Aureibaculum sp. 2210JD6-5]MDY7395104.1 proline dehydrogenase family protein [Aureibaculum sp. 2210JD6-5]
MNTIFEDTKTAFALKSDAELERAYFLFKMIKSEPLVRIGAAITNFALKAHLRVEQLIRASVFDHFCGGITEEDCLPVIDKMYEYNVHSVLDYSVEGQEAENQFDLALEKTLQNISFAKEKPSIPFAVFKPTGFGRSSLLQKVSEGGNLTAQEKINWTNVVNRFDTACKAAYDKDVCVLIDAEESWLQDAADKLIETMMEKYNTEKAIVYNTLQMYRWDRLDYLKELHQRAQKKGYKIGMKMVRGAYMEKERERAEEKGYPSPICADKQATDQNYDAGIDYMLTGKGLSLYAGTHNELSTLKVMELAKEKGLAKDNKTIWFGQLYGMSDHITYNLAKEGYNVSKYLPYGAVRDVMPYLIRRAEENTSVAGQTSRELSLLKKERKRRKKLGRL